MYTELMFDEEEKRFHVVRFMPVAVREYDGGGGALPLDPSTCPLADGEHTPSCESRSSSSLCGGYYGHMNSNVVRCVETKAKP